MNSKRTIKKQKLVAFIYSAFDGVQLEEGIGLWEAQAEDNPLEDKEWEKQCLDKAKNDERNDWQKVSLENLIDCGDIINYIDAKGFRYYLPLWLLMDIGYDDEVIQKQFPHKMMVDIAFHLSRPLEVWANGKYENKFGDNKLSALNHDQKKCIATYFQYKMNIVKQKYQEYSIQFGSDESEFLNDKAYIALQKARDFWGNRIL
ncbi:hypothetical protein MM236_17070 [Belliella sp. DSM 107340]|uniref:DUF4274 domain-containing protein n=1 Tax=Belliella calami TaxID=2923436 RepID=A0ABS9USW0_9BACT|nr:DUF6714 family protein [Belliella calami]MCH7399711.1 hypothetical protein [Belliella calami]